MKTVKPSLSFIGAWLQFSPYIRPRRAIVVAVLLVSGLVTAANLIQASLLASVIDSALAFDWSRLAAPLAIYLAILAVDAAAAFFQKYFYGIFSAGFLRDFRTGALERLQKIPTAAMVKRHTGDLLSRFSHDLSLVQDFFGHTFLDAFKQLVMLIAAAAYMAYLNWRLLCVSIAIVPLALLVVGWLMKPMRAYYKRANAALGQANALVADALGGISTVKAYKLADLFSKKFADRVDEALSFDIKGFGIMRWTPPFNILMRAMPTVICVGYGSLLIIRGELKPGALIAFNYLLGFVQWPLAYLPDLFNRIKRALGAAERITEILELPPERGDGEDFSGADSEVVVSFSDVVFAYDEGPAVLSGLSFELGRGETLALVGASGCGKSTILKLLRGDYEARQGSIKLFGHETRSWSLRALRSQFAVVDQDVFLFPVSVYDNIAYGRAGAESEAVIAAAKAANVEEFAPRLPEGYDTLVGERGVKLSGGQKQRIALARALVAGAPILLLDEPTSALDTHSEALVQEAIDHSLAGQTAIIVAHRLSTIKKADRILVIDQGRVAERGTHEELFAKGGLYTSLYLSQFDAPRDSADSVSGENR